MHKFKTVIEAAQGGRATVALVPSDVAQALGGLKQKRVLGKLNGIDFSTATFPYGGARLFVGVPKEARSMAGVEVGDEVELEIELDTAPRTVPLAPEMEAAFTAEPQLRKRFDALSRSRQRLLAEPVVEAKKPETRAARLDKSLAELRTMG